MELKEIREKSNRMLANFIDEIGLDGDFYVSNCNYPMVWGKPKLNACGEFVAPSSERLEKILQSSKYDEKTKRILNEKGLILINENYKQKEADSDFFVTIIHETIHSSRNLLLFDSVRDDTNENSYNFNNGKFEQNTSNYDFTYADATQEILKGSIDTSKKTIDSYKDKSSEELEDMEWEEGKIDAKKKKQFEIDEALVELMALLSYKLYRNKEKGKQIDFWYTLEEIVDVFAGEENLQGKASKIGEIVLKHKDFELFNWMLDPITYSQGDIHYDFFEQYTKYDQDLLQELYELAGLDMEDILQLQETNEIDIKDIKEIATSRTAIEELTNCIFEIMKAKDSKTTENERE